MNKIERTIRQALADNMPVEDVRACVDELLDSYAGYSADVIPTLAREDLL